jgi:hypothetical protein
MPFVAAISSAAAVDNFGVPTVAISVTRSVDDPGSGGGANSGSVTIGLPPGSPGQMMVAIIGFRGSPAFTMPSGWTAARQVTNASTANSGPVSFLFAYKVRTPSDGFNAGFARTGGSVAQGWIIGYTPSSGSLSFGAVSGTAGNTASPATLPSFTPPGARNLIVAAVTHGSFWSTPQAGFAAASLPATASPGTLFSGPTVSATEWTNVAFAARGFGGANVGTQIVDLWDVPNVATGALTMPFPVGNYDGAAVSFTWSP